MAVREISGSVAMNPDSDCWVWRVISITDSDELVRGRLSGAHAVPDGFTFVARGSVVSVGAADQACFDVGAVDAQLASVVAFGPLLR